MKNKEDLELLVKVVSIQSSMSDDIKINNFIEGYLKNISGVSVEKDSYGNIYATKGEGKKGYKCIISHTDTVHKIHPDRKIFVYDDNLFAMSKTTYVDNSEAVYQVGIGGDDKCGVYTCLKAMVEFNDIKSVFFRFEESGCNGSSRSNINFFDDCNFIVQCDRRGKSDFITKIGATNICSKEFQDTMRPIYEKYGFKTTIGLSTDVGALKSRGLNISACNLSSGYYNPHTAEESININDLENTYNMVSEMFNTYGDRRFEHKYEKPIYLPSITSHVYTYGSRFSTSLGSNYFNNLLNKNEMDLDISSSMSASLIEVDMSGMYKFTGEEVIDIDQAECPHCKESNTLMFSMNDGSFFCTNKEHFDYVDTGELYKELTMKIDDIDYVYNRIYSTWIPLSDAKWDKELETYSSVHMK